MASATTILPGQFLTIGAAELARARQRVKSPNWAKAAEVVRKEAEAGSKNWPEIPRFDHAWFDASPGRNYNETYNEFAAYAYPAWRLLADAQKMVFADAVLLRNLGDDLFGIVNADIRGQEAFFQFGEEFIVDLPPGNEQGADVREHDVTGLAQRAFELVESLGEEGHGGRG